MTITEPFPAAKAERKGGKLVHHLISADSHINEPADLWTSRVAAKWRDRVPRVESFEQGDAWVIEGMPGRCRSGSRGAGQIAAAPDGGASTRSAAGAG